MRITIDGQEATLAEVARLARADREARRQASRRRLREARAHARRRAEMDREERVEDAVHRCRRRREARRRELEDERARRFRVRVLDEEKPRVRERAPRALYSRGSNFGRLVGDVNFGPARASSERVRGLYMKITTRGHGSKKPYRRRELERLCRYLLRDGATDVEAGQVVTSISADPVELAAFARAYEEMQKASHDKAVVYKHAIVPLDCELSADGRRAVVEEICGDLGQLGLPFLAVLHAPSEEGDQRNFHLHVVLMLRPFERHAAFDWSFAPGYRGDLNDERFISVLRWRVATAMNRRLAAEGSRRRYSHLHKDRRGDLTVSEPKLGAAAAALERKGVKTALGDLVRAARTQNDRVAEADLRGDGIRFLQGHRRTAEQLEAARSRLGAASETIVEAVAASRAGLMAELAALHARQAAIAAMRATFAGLHVLAFKRADAVRRRAMWLARRRVRLRAVAEQFRQTTAVERTQIASRLRTVKAARSDVLSTAAALRDMVGKLLRTRTEKVQASQAMVLGIARHERAELGARHGEVAGRRVMLAKTRSILTTANERAGRRVPAPAETNVVGPEPGQPQRAAADAAAPPVFSGRRPAAEGPARLKRNTAARPRPNRPAEPQTYFERLKILRLKAREIYPEPGKTSVPLLRQFLLALRNVETPERQQALAAEIEQLPAAVAELKRLGPKVEAAYQTALRQSQQTSADAKRVATLPRGRSNKGKER